MSNEETQFPKAFEDSPGSQLILEDVSNSQLIVYLSIENLLEAEIVLLGELLTLLNDRRLRSLLRRRQQTLGMFSQLIRELVKTRFRPSGTHQVGAEIQRTSGSLPG